MIRSYPDRPIVGVGVVVWRDGEVLLVRRANPPRAGSWSLPGGAQELGETVFETAMREVREETGIDIAVRGIVDVVDSIHRDDNGRVAYHYTLIDVAAVWRGGIGAAADDAADLAWASPDRLDGFALWSETVRIIRKSRELLPPTVPGTPG